VTHRFIVALTGILLSLSAFTAVSAAIPLPETALLPVVAGDPETESVPFLSMADDMAEFGYVEDEYQLSGNAVVYDYVNNAEQSPAVTAITAPVPYATRMFVRRPADMSRFNGTVYFEIINATRQYDSDVSWQYSDRMIMFEGAVYVGITSKSPAVNFLRDSFGKAPYTIRNADRYAGMLMTDDGHIWDMLMQSGALLKSDAATDNPLAGWGVERLILTGFSQSAGYVKTFVNSFHEMAVMSDTSSIFDGYFDAGGSYASKAVNLMGGGSDSNPAGDSRNKILLPVPAPVMRFQTETELAAWFGAQGVRQTEEESALIRTYDMAGGAHVDSYQKVFEDEQNLEELGIDPATAICKDDPSTLNNLRTEYVHSALMRRLDKWIAHGTLPPPSRLITMYRTEQGGLAVVRDELGVVEGGIRLAGIEVPTGVTTGVNDNLFCTLQGSHAAFTRPELDARYPTHAAYLQSVIFYSVQAWLDGFLLFHDGVETVLQAFFSDIGADLT